MPRLAYLFTTFPKLSEQFFMREVLELRTQGVDLEVFSMIGGRPHSEAGPVREMGVQGWVCLLFELLYWSVCRAGEWFGESCVGC